MRVRAAFGVSVVLGVTAAASCSSTGNHNASGAGGGTSGSEATTSSSSAGPTGSSSSGAGACMGCVKTTDCGAGNDCAQFAGDTYCAADCTNGGSCPSGSACTPVTTAEGQQVSACVPVAGPCGLSMSASSSSSGGTTSSSAAASSSSGSGTCAHSICTAGAALTSGCDPCATQICAKDPYCCQTKWSTICVNEVASICGESCSGSTSSSSSSTGASSSGTTSSSSSSSGTTSSGGSVGPGGGTLPALSFAIVGDTRPPTEDDTAGYPTAIITKIWQDVQNASPRPAFAVTTGDYMFAGPKNMPYQQGAQMDLYMTARANYSNVVFPAMGNHECDGATAGNCYACGSACSYVGGSCLNNFCQTPNFSTFISRMLTPINQALPYYTINIQSSAGVSPAWTSKFVFVACNHWSQTQAMWLDTQLATPTTYTFVVRHEGSSATTAPCLSGTGTMNADTIMSQHPYTLLIAGHTHTYAHYSSQKQVIVGNGGAPLTGSVNYGYVIARQSGASITFTAYDYNTNGAIGSFSVQ